jgi:PST family polysaccharide transporter
LRFRLLAVIESVRVILDAGLKVLLAWWGLGAYSFVVAIVGVTTLMQLVYLFAAPPPLRFNPQLRYWKYLAGNGARIIGASFCYWIISQGDYVVLGRFATAEVVGLYFFAFSISQHTRNLLTLHLTRVLFPALSKLPSTGRRQVDAFLRAARMLAMLAVPTCLMQAAVAGPLIRLLFEPRWHSTIPLIQVMCLGMALPTISGPAASLLQAQGRFRARMWLSAASAALFLPMAIAGAWGGSPLRLSVFVALVWSAMAVLDLAVAVWPSVALRSALDRIYRVPTLAGAAAVGLALLSWQGVRWLGPADHDVIQLLWTVLVSVTAYILLVRSVAPDRYRELLAQATAWRRPRAATPATGPATARSVAPQKDLPAEV